MAKQKRSWGSGSLFQRGSTWWIGYRHHGKFYRETAGTTVKEKAKNLLKDRMAALHTNTFDPSTKNTTVEDLYELLRTDYTINSKKSVVEIEKNWNLHLQPFLGHLRATDISYPVIGRYIEHRQSEKAANATINRELANLKRACHLGLKAGKLIRVPVFPTKLQENNIRTGFLESQQYDKLAQATAQTGLWLRAIFEVGYTFGWRKQEVVGLRVKQIDLQNRTVRLEVGTTKNGEGRLARMTETLYQLLKQCCEGKKPDDAVFTREVKKGKNHVAKDVRTFRKAWESACKEAGCPDLLFHDLRRTAVRNMVRASIPERVAMMISGHKTRSVFERYNIISERDIIEAASRLEMFQQAAREQAKQEYSQNAHSQPNSALHGNQATTAKSLVVN